MIPPRFLRGTQEIDLYISTITGFPPLKWLEPFPGLSRTFFEVNFQDILPKNDEDIFQRNGTSHHTKFQ